MKNYQAPVLVELGTADALVLGAVPSLQKDNGQDEFFWVM